MSNKNLPYQLQIVQNDNFIGGAACGDIVFFTPCREFRDSDFLDRFILYTKETVSFFLYLK